jgi:hypothetical protein
MELIQTLRTILHNDYIAEVKQAGFFKLDEQKVGNYPDTLVRFHKFRDFLPCKFDVENSNKLFPIFDIKQPGLSSISDYVLFYEKRRGDKPVLYVFLCNMKSTNATGSSKQVEATHILSEYIIKMAVRHLGYKKFQVRFRALLFTLRHTARFNTKVSRDKYVRLGRSGILQMPLKAGNNCYLENLAR